MDRDEEGWGPMQEVAQARDEELRAAAEAIDERWDKLAAGELSDAEAAALEREDPALYELFRPLGDNFVERATAAVQGPAADVIPLRTQRKRMAVWGGLVAAAIAAGLVVLALPSGRLEPLPSYGLELRAGDRAERGDAAEPAEGAVSPGSRVEITLRPATAVTGDVVAGLFIRSPDGSVRAWPGDVETAPGGTCVLYRTVGVPFALPPGTYDLTAVIGRPGSFDVAAVRRTWDAPSDDPRWQSFHRRLVVGGPP